jgi:hypothetical protein
MGRGSVTYTPGRGRFHSVTDLIEHIERNNCVGCAVPDPKDIAEYGPGGCCSILAATILEEPMTELDDDGEIITCNQRTQVPPDPAQLSFAIPTQRSAR